MFDVKITRKRLAMHWHYYRFTYVIVLAAAMIGANLLLSGTAPRTPPDRRVDVIIVSKAYDATLMEALEQELLCALPPDQKEVNLIVMPLVKGQELATLQVLAARMTGQEADIWILPSDVYRGYAEDGAFTALEGQYSNLGLPVDFNGTAARVIVKPGENAPGQQHVCGIPLDSFKGLAPCLDPDGMVMAFPSYYVKNPENGRIVARQLLTKTDLNMESTAPGGGSFGLYIATQYIDGKAAMAWKPALVKSGLPETIGVFPIAYQLGREKLVADLLAARMPNYASGMVMVRREVFAILAGQGKLLPLDVATDLLKLPEGIDLSAGRASAVDQKGVSGPEKLYGIPLDSFTGLTSAFNPSGMVLAFPAQGNEQLASAIGAANAVLAQLD